MRDSRKLEMSHKSHLQVHRNRPQNSNFVGDYGIIDYLTKHARELIGYLDSVVKKYLI